MPENFPGASKFLSAKGLAESPPLIYIAPLAGLALPLLVVPPNTTSVAVLSIVVSIGMANGIVYSRCTTGVGGAFAHE